MQIPAYVDMLLSIVRAPERRFWKAFSKLLGGRFLESHRDTLLNLAFIPHQACLMADAIGRTLWRRYISHANMLEWETMAQSEIVGWTAVSRCSIGTSTSRRCFGCRSFFWPVRFPSWCLWFALFGSPRPWWWDG